VTRSAVLLEVAERLLGSCEVTAVLGDAVLRIRDARSQEFIVKQHDTRSKHDREVHAYWHWTASLGPSASRLIAADSAAMTIVITRLPGHHARAAHEQPGAHGGADRGIAGSGPVILEIRLPGRGSITVSLSRRQFAQLLAVGALSSALPGTRGTDDVTRAARVLDEPARGRR
jgi:hypothetical protein